MAQQEYLVVRNDEEQYSIWAQDGPVPDGWQAAGFTGSRDQCLAHIDQVWTDMRPRSLRVAMGEG
jgi:MbtH protein